MTNVYVVSTIWNPSKGLQKFVTDGIKKASGGPWTHTQIVFCQNGKEVMYESGHPEGFQKTENYEFRGSLLKVRQPLFRDLTSEEMAVGVAWWEDKIHDKIPYGTLKLLTYLLLFRTRKFWKKIGWCPMAIDKIWGDFCSAAVVNNLKFMSRLPGSEDLDLFPGESGEFQSCVDIYNKLK